MGSPSRDFRQASCGVAGGAQKSKFPFERTTVCSTVHVAAPHVPPLAHSLADLAQVGATRIVSVQQPSH